MTFATLAQEPKAGKFTNLPGLCTNQDPFPEVTDTVVHSSSAAAVVASVPLPLARL